MRLKSLADLKNINPTTPQSQQLVSAFKAYELERSNKQKKQVSKQNPSCPTLSPAAKELARISEPQQILLSHLVLRVQAGLILSSPEEALCRVKKFFCVWAPRQKLLLSELPISQETQSPHVSI